MVHRGALILLTTVLMLGACVRLSSAQNPYLTLAALEADPAARIAMPGSEVIRHIGHERLDTLDGPVPSETGAIFGVQVTQDTVHDFYDQRLRSLGWQRQTYGSVSSGELVNWRWCKPEMDLSLSIFDPQRYARVGIEDGERYRTVFDARIVASGPGPCPAPVRTMPPSS